MKKEGLDKINMVESINKQHNNIEENSYDKSEDSSSSVGDLTSIASLNSNTFQNILTNPEQLDSILKECKIPEFDVNDYKDDYDILQRIKESLFQSFILYQNNLKDLESNLDKVYSKDKKWKIVVIKFNPYETGIMNYVKFFIENYITEKNYLS